MTKFSKKLKKNLFLAHFGPIFPIFLGKRFSRKIWLRQAQLHMGSQHHDKFQKKLMMQFQENSWTDGRTEGQKDGQTLFYRNLPAIAGGPKSFDLCHYGSTPKSRVSHARR